jgi:6-pyruvoyltetrahydropterin/6-carboxytetrahydropterin synthase
MKFYFGTDNLDVRNWAADYGGLKDLKKILEAQFDHTLLVSADDPEMEWYKEAEQRGIAKLTILPRLGCEGLADMIYRFVNEIKELKDDIKRLSTNNIDNNINNV